MRLWLPASCPRLGPVCVVLECLSVTWTNTHEGLSRTLSKMWYMDTYREMVSLFFFFFFQFGPNCSLLTNARVNLIQRDSEGSTAENGKGDRDLTTPF